MKTFVLCLLALAAFTSVAARQHQLRNSIDDLVRNALEYIRQQMKEHDPYPVPQLPEHNINDDETKIYLTVDVSNILVSKASDFTIDHIENNLIDFWAKFGVTIPTAHIEGNFKVNGSVMDHKVSGSGTFSVDITNLKVEGFVQNELQDGKYLHIQSMTIDYDIEDLKFKEQGLVVEGMTEEELEKIFDTEMLKFIKDNEKVVGEKIAEQATAEINELIKGKTLEEVIEWLRHLIDPTAAPALA